MLVMHGSHSKRCSASATRNELQEQAQNGVISSQASSLPITVHGKPSCDVQPDEDGVQCSLICLVRSTLLQVNYVRGQLTMVFCSVAKLSGSRAGGAALGRVTAPRSTVFNAKPGGDNLTTHLFTLPAQL